MKTDIHPGFHPTTFKCVCGAEFIAGSTIEGGEFKTEICSACHPFYTGKQKLVDSSGRVDKFMAKMKKAQAISEKNVKTVDGEEEEEKAEVAEEEAPAEEKAEVAEEAPAEEEKKEEEEKVAEEEKKEEEEEKAA